MTATNRDGGTAHTGTQCEGSFTPDSRAIAVRMGWCPDSLTRDWTWREYRTLRRIALLDGPVYVDDNGSIRPSYIVERDDGSIRARRAERGRV